MREMSLRFRVKKHSVNPDEYRETKIESWALDPIRILF